MSHQGCLSEDDTGNIQDFSVIMITQKGEQAYFMTLNNYILPHVPAILSLHAAVMCLMRLLCCIIKYIHWNVKNLLQCHSN